MPKEVWKTFEDNTLTHSAAHYIMTIHDLLQDQGYARVTDVARRLNITRGSTSISLKPLKKRGLVVEDENRFLKLSAEADHLARIIEENDALMKSFLHDVLGVSEGQAEVDACKIEHLLSIETSVKLSGLITCIRKGGKVVDDFLKEVNKHTNTCAQNLEGCRVCKSSCFYEQPEQEKPVPITPKRRRQSP